MKYIIGTRGSKLALVQAQIVCDRLKSAYPGDEFEIKIIKTTGDMIQDKPLDKIGSRGLFTAQIEDEIMGGSVHIGVHSMKDMPSYPEPGLDFTKAWTREDPRDALILREASSLHELPEGAVIGTGSKRRALQLKKLRPDLNIVGIRGNVDTRLRKMHEQQLDGIVLAAAGLKRLHMEEVITEYLDFMVPAPAQGILALEIKADNHPLREMLDALSDPEVEFAAGAERGFLREIGADCHVPVGAICTQNENDYSLRAIFGTEDGSKLAETTVTGTDPELMAKEATKKIRAKIAGTVYLVGGGPGDEKLMTVKAMELVEKADCIIYDRLAPQIVLEKAKENCELIYVGKADSHHIMKQEEINALLVKKAIEKNIVVRLKGGDPYVFGRGGEEALYLLEKGVPFQVVPGVTSATSALALAGIPITHRGIAEGFRVVTAHNKDGKAEIDYESMAKGRETCVFLMGLSALEDICSGFRSAGLPENHPVAVISKASTPEQMTVCGTLADIEALCEEKKPASPAIIVVGKVVELHDKLDKSCKGRFLTAKVGHEVSGTTKMLLDVGYSVTEWMAGHIELVPAKITKNELEKYDCIAFTGRNGVNAFFKSMSENNLDIRSLAGVKIAAVGKATVEVLKSHGITADIAPDIFSGRHLAETIAKTLGRDANVLYPCGKVTSGSLENGLEHVTNLVVYENVEGEEAVPKLENFDGIIFTCASSAERFFHKVSPEDVTCPVYSIGESCTAALEKMGAENILTADSFDYKGLLALIKEKTRF